MTPDAIASLLATRMDLQIEPEMAKALARYLDLLLRWNAKTNLSAIREPEAIVLRHFGESLQCAQALPVGVRTVLDYGSGAGFPGAVCALARPEMAVTLVESQGRKAAFLQELCRTLALNAAVHDGRVEALPAERRFDAVTLRAVDRMEEACTEAQSRAKAGGWLVLLTTQEALRVLAAKLPGMAWESPVLLKGTLQGVIAIGRVLGS